jgi:hypothetical protein
MALERFDVLQVTEYNDFAFPASVETVGYKITPKYDTSGRTVIYSVFDITLRWFMSDADPVSAEVADMVARLQRPAAVLKYTERGFGVGEIINQGLVWDVDWGPKPGPVQLTPHGNEQTVECVWAVQFAIPTCDDALYKNAVREFCYAVEYAINRSGLTTRTYKAHASIAITRPAVDARIPPDTADRLLELITPPPLLGYYRESQNRSLSEDKSTLTLTVVDSQWPAFAPPPGCVTASLEHSFSTQAGNWAKWTVVFNGLYEVAKDDEKIGLNTVRTIQDFLTRVDARLALIATMIIGKGLPGAPVAGAGKPLSREGIIPVAFAVAEPNVYGVRQIRISMTVSIAGLGLSEILEKGGLWKPWGARYNLWQAQTPNIHDPRGESKLKFFAGDDSITDLCGDSPPKPPPSKRTPEPGTGGSGGTGRLQTPFQNIIEDLFPGPTPSSSWIDYVCTATTHVETGRVEGSTLPTDPITAGQRSGRWDVLRGGPPAALPAGSAFPPLAKELGPSSTDGGPFVQQRTKPAMYVTIRGHAVRVGHPIPVPELVEVNGQKVTLVGAPMFATGVVGNAIVPVYGARWEMTYLATAPRSASAPVPTPANPYLA